MVWIWEWRGVLDSQAKENPTVDESQGRLADRVVGNAKEWAALRSATTISARKVKLHHAKAEAAESEELASYPQAGGGGGRPPRADRDGARPHARRRDLGAADATGSGPSSRRGLRSSRSTPKAPGRHRSRSRTPRAWPVGADRGQCRPALDVEWYHGVLRCHRIARRTAGVNVRDPRGSFPRYRQFALSAGWPGESSPSLNRRKMALGAGRRTDSPISFSG